MSLDKNNILKNIINDGYGWDEKNVQERDDFYKKYGNIFQLENIDSLTPEIYREFWKDGIFHWGDGIPQSTGNLIKEFPWETIQKNLKILVDESKSLSERIKNFQNSESGGKYIKNSTYTVILHMVNPQKYAIINILTLFALDELNLSSKKERKTDDWIWVPKLENTILKLCTELNTDTWKIDWIWARLKEQQSTQWWLISAGKEKGRQKIWNEFRNSNTVGFYWNETGDLSKLNNDQIKEKFKKLDKDWGPGRDILRIKKNDIIFVKEGKRGFYAIGKAADTYQYNTNQSYHHTIPVQWITTQHYDTTGKVVSLQLNNALSIIPNQKRKGEILKYYDMSLSGKIIGEDLGDDTLDRNMESLPIELLKDKKQIIFYGPPGTGKTRKGMLLARSFVSNNNPIDFEKVRINENVQRNDIQKINLTDDQYHEYVFKKINAECMLEGYTLAQEQGNKNLYSLKNEKNEIRLAVHFSSSSKESTEDLFLGVPTLMVDFLAGVPEKNRFHLILNDSVKNFVVLPFEIEQKYARFVDSPKTGKWDNEGIKQHAYHITVTNDGAELPVRDGTYGQETKYDCEKFVRNIKMIFGNFIRNVTFHPSYSYEEFVEGIRPKLDNDELLYEIQNGIFKSICDEAKEDSDNKYVLFIDEINRGNISKIFGELITLIENDKRELLQSSLTYTKESFTIPKNLYIIGTMNTADKSLSLLDVALRRRFGFVELMPEKDLIQNEIEVAGVKFKPSDIMMTLNKKIKNKVGRERQIGHAYFMKKNRQITTGEELQSAFANEIVPLLQEYLYEENEDMLEILGQGFVDEDELELKDEWKSELEDFKDALEKIPDL